MYNSSTYNTFFSANNKSNIKWNKDVETNKSEEKSGDKEQEEDKSIATNISRNDLLLKLKSLTVRHEADVGDFNSDSDIDSDSFL